MSELNIFMIGSRVSFHKGQNDEDHGIIVKEYDDCCGTSWWVRWDSNGEVAWIHERVITHEVQKVQVQEVLPLKPVPFQIPEASLSAWVLKDSPSLEEIQGVCKFMKFIKE